MHPIVGLFNKVKGTTFANIDTVTKIKLTGGRSNPFHNRDVTKIVTGASVILFFTKESNGYENMVRRQMTLEGIPQNDFKMGARAYGTPIPGTPFMEHNGETYIDVIYLKPGKVSYYVDGVPSLPSSIPGLPVSKPTDTSQGGISKKIIFRTYKINSIKSIRALKQTFVNGIHF